MYIVKSLLYKKKKKNGGGGDKSALTVKKVTGGFSESRYNV